MSFPRENPTCDPSRLGLIGIVAASILLSGCGRRDDVLARVGAQTITARELQRAAAAASRGEGGTATQDLQPVFNALVTRALMLEAARALHRAGALGPGDSLAARGGSPQRERQLLDAVYRVEVLDRVAKPDSGALRAAWARHPESRELAAADVAVITISDSSLAMKFRAVLRGGRGLHDAGRLLSPPLEARVQSLLFPSRDPLWQRLKPMLASMGERQVRGPVRVGGRWVFVELLDRKLRYTWIDDLPSPEAANLRSQVLEQAREARFSTFMDSLATAIAPQIFADRLARLRPVERANPLLLALAWALALALWA